MMDVLMERPGGARIWCRVVTADGGADDEGRHGEHDGEQQEGCSRQQPTAGAPVEPPQQRSRQQQPDYAEDCCTHSAREDGRASQWPEVMQHVRSHPADRPDQRGRQPSHSSGDRLAPRDFGEAVGIHGGSSTAGTVIINDCASSD